MTKLPTGYTSHLADGCRVAVGSQLIERELYKFFCRRYSHQDLRVNPQEHLNRLDSDVAIRDFWNLAYAVTMGVKLKGVVKEVTSMRLSWTLEEGIPLDPLVFTARYSSIDLTGVTFAQTKEILAADPALRKSELEEMHLIYGHRLESLYEPIIVVEQEGVRRVIDGNGRLCAHIHGMAQCTSAYVGRKVDSTKSQHWVATSLILEMIELAREARDTAALCHLLRESDNALYSFLHFEPEGSDLRASVLKEL